VRVFAASAAVALCAACGTPETPLPAGSSTPPSHAVGIDLGGVARVRGDLPAGYEVGELVGRVAPLALWGFGPQWVADPPQCGVLADPPVDGATVRGWSASGSGGIVYVMAAAGTALDPAVPGECADSTLTAGHTSGTVATVDGPTIAGATTLGLRVESTTVVEGGTETHSHADTFTAYLEGHVASVTVVTDPGSAGEALDADFAAGLLVKTVSALRG
jgi:Domain of unknown function (DUF5642)